MRKFLYDTLTLVVNSKVQVRPDPNRIIQVAGNNDITMKYNS